MPRCHTLLLAVTLAGATLAGCDSPIGQADARTGIGASAAGTARQIERGRYLVAVMDCSGCHNRGSFSPDPAAGVLQGAEIGHEVPGLGIFYPPNLTPDRETGLGRWTEDEIVTAIRTGRRPDGRELAPAMPWRAYAALSDEDARAVARFLKSLPPSTHRVPGPATAETAPSPYLTMRMPADLADGR